MPPNRPPQIPHAKQRGEWAEIRFLSRATEHGLRLSKPWGDSAPYDFAVDHQGRFLRVQVKCTTCKRGHSYKCHLDSNGQPYLSTEIDFFAAYVIPADAWFILPLAATHRQPDILLTPQNKNSKYAKYQEAWHLLMKAPR
jgi:hypothetical protein